MEAIRVVVQGALGRMGGEVIKAIVREPGMKVVGVAEKEVPQLYFDLPEIAEKVPYSSNLGHLLQSCYADVLVDFTNIEASMATVGVAASYKVNLVIGTTGHTKENLAEIEQLCQTKGIGVVVAPNFSLGAVLLMHLAKTAAKFFDYAEITEMHHEKKIDAPSGTALATARAMLEARGRPFIYPRTEKEVLSGVRGGQMEGVAIHSVRLPGFMAAQEVMLSGMGQTLSLRHEAISRESYMPGIILAIKEVVKRKGLIYGLDTLLGL